MAEGAPRRPERLAPISEHDGELVQKRESAQRPKPLPKRTTKVIDEEAMESLLEDLLFERAQKAMAELLGDDSATVAQKEVNKALGEVKEVVEQGRETPKRTPIIRISSTDHVVSDFSQDEDEEERKDDVEEDRKEETELENARKRNEEVEEPERTGLLLNPLMIVTNTLFDEYDTSPLEISEDVLPDYTSTSYAAPSDCDDSIGNKLRMQVLVPPTHVGYLKKHVTPGQSHTTVRRFESARELATRIPSSKLLQPPPRPRKPIPKSGKRKRVKRIDHGRLQRPTEDVPLPQPFLVHDAPAASTISLKSSSSSNEHSSPPQSPESTSAKKPAFDPNDLETADIMDEILNEMEAAQVHKSDDTSAASKAARTRRITTLVKEASKLGVSEDEILRQYRVRASINDDDLVDELNDFGALMDLTSTL